jgi:hypothetical protein
VFVSRISRLSDPTTVMPGVLAGGDAHELPTLGGRNSCPLSRRVRAAIGKVYLKQLELSGYFRTTTNRHYQMRRRERQFVSGSDADTGGRGAFAMSLPCLFMLPECTASIGRRIAPYLTRGGPPPWIAPGLPSITAGWF